MALKFHDTDTTLAAALHRTATGLAGETITLRQLMERVGEQGLLLFCGLLALPFLIPVSIPGISTAFGVVIILIGVGVTLNRVPWLPRRLMERPLTRERLLAALEKGAGAFARMERWIKPRLPALTDSAAINRLNGLALIASGVLLLVPFGFIPLSNTIPAVAVLCLVLGMAQRDGVFILAGYAALILTVIYFGALTWAVYVGGMLLLT
jgi:hypothetical protein